MYDEILTNISKIWKENLQEKPTIVQERYPDDYNSIIRLYTGILVLWKTNLYWITN